jgi:hypothetical protein
MKRLVSKNALNKMMLCLSLANSGLPIAEWHQHRNLLAVTAIDLAVSHEIAFLEVDPLRVLLEISETEEKVTTWKEK